MTILEIILLIAVVIVTGGGLGYLALDTLRKAEQMGP